MATVLVTGATGFIGRALVERLRREDHVRVLAPTRDELDLLARTIALPEGIDVVVHCAASRDRANDDPSRLVEETEINVAAAARLYEAARVRGVSSIVHLSTISVFRPSEDSRAILDEDSPQVVAPAHPYALTKRLGEEIARAFRPSFRAIAIVRPGMVYGPGLSPKGNFARLFARIREGDAFRIGRPDGDRYSPVHLDDVIDVLVRCIESPANLEVNVAGPDAIPERTLLADLASVLGLTARFELVDEPTVSVATAVTRADALFPRRKSTPWREGLAIGFADLARG